VSKYAEQHQNIPDISGSMIIGIHASLALMLQSFNRIIFYRFRFLILLVTLGRLRWKDHWFNPKEGHKGRKKRKNNSNVIF